MMQKVIPAGSWDGPGMEQPAHIIKVSSRGLIGNDRRDFLKIASHVFADIIDDMKFASDELPIHLNAIGATELYSCNRNGDGFSARTCRDYHPSFVKDALLYENHKNKDRSKSYGRVKHSAYNEDMHRIELLVLANMSKRAAERNGGLPMRPGTIGRLQNGESVGFSMGATLPFDVCSNCHNKAASRREYCTEDTCISPSGRRGFGCADGLTKVADEGWQQYVDNPNPTFIDISQVRRNADRIATGAVADYLQKAASVGHTPGGAELAELWAAQGAGFQLLPEQDAIFHSRTMNQLKVARSLAEIERQFESSPSERDIAFARAFDQGLSPTINTAPLGKLGSDRFKQGLRALAQEKIALSLPAFINLLVPDDREKAAALTSEVSRHLPGIFGRLTAVPDLASALKESPFTKESGTPSGELCGWAQKHAADNSLAVGAVQNRVARSAINNRKPPAFIEKSAIVKTAGTSHAEQLAKHYGLYKIAFISEVPQGPDIAQLKRMVVLSNYLSPSTPA